MWSAYLVAHPDVVGEAGAPFSAVPDAG